ncbi:hypothetical protein ACWCQ1_43375 [Streptomyces sp. NPDC002144]|uniref:hypothetical protein n=1 Tax=Streptomyces sp. NPDC006668 TaxID=3156903 RepID=UPI0033DBB766
MTAAAVTAFGAQAVAAPMPWETSKTPTAVSHSASAAAGATGLVTVLCAAGCYQ